MNFKTTNLSKILTALLGLDKDEEGDKDERLLGQGTGYISNYCEWGVDGYTNNAANMYLFTPDADCRKYYFSISN
jgi:hypothetical protein